MRERFLSNHCKHFVDLPSLQPIFKFCKLKLMYFWIQIRSRAIFIGVVAPAWPRVCFFFCMLITLIMLVWLVQQWLLYHSNLVTLSTYVCLVRQGLFFCMLITLIIILLVHLVRQWLLYLVNSSHTYHLISTPSTAVCVVSDYSSSYVCLVWQCLFFFACWSPLLC